MNPLKSATKFLTLSLMALSLSSYAEQAAEPVDASQPAQVEISQINLNTASAQELSQLAFIGAKKAQAIVEYRKAHGPFKSLEELENVKGIGANTVERNRDRMLVAQ